MNASNARWKTWTPAVPRKIPNNIVSSDYTTARVFIPSYEKERNPRMEQLLTNDYQRIWWQEKQIWDKTFAEEAATKRILPRMLIKRKVPTCVTVKYPTRMERLKGRKKEVIKQKSNESSNIEETKLAKHIKDAKLVNCDETKSEKDEETKSRKHKETQSENHEDVKLGTCEETKSEKDEEVKSRKHEEIQLENHEDVKLGTCEETKSEKDEEAKSRKREEIQLENHEDVKLGTCEETKSEKDEEAKSRKHEEIQSENHEDIKLGMCKEKKSENSKWDLWNFIE